MVCKRQFTVKVGTIFEDSKIALNLWLQAIVLMTASKKGISPHQLHRTLELTYKTAWFGLKGLSPSVPRPLEESQQQLGCFGATVCWTSAR